MPSCKVYILQVNPGLRLNPFLQVKLVIFILPRLNMHSDELKKLAWSLNNKKKGQVRISFGYYTSISILAFRYTKVNREENCVGLIMLVAELQR